MAGRALPPCIAVLVLLGAGAHAHGRGHEVYEGPLVVHYVKSHQADPAKPRWHKGDRSAPVQEGAWIRQQLDGVKIDPSSLVSLEGQVAGADPIRRIRGRDAAERWLVTPEVAAAVTELRVLVKQELGPDYDVWLNGALDSGGRARGCRKTMHASGRAVDLDVYQAGTNGQRGGKASRKLDLFAPLVARVFTTRVTADGSTLRGYVLHEGDHVHASLESPSLGGVVVESPPPPVAQSKPAT